MGAARLCVVFTAFALLLVAAPQALAADSPAMKRALRHYDNLQFPQALKILVRLARRPGLSKKQRARVYLYQGFCTFYVRTPQRARDKFRRALKLNPQLRLPRQTPPPLRRLVALERSRLGIQPPAPPVPKLRFQITPKAPSKAGQPIFFQGACTKRPFGARLFIKVKRAGSNTYKRYRLQWQGTLCSGQVPNPYPATHKGQRSIAYVFEAKRGTQHLATWPPLSRPKRFRWSPPLARVVGRIPPKPPQTPKGKSKAGLIVGVTLGVAALLGGGAVLTYYLLNQPAGPSVKVRISITAN